MPELRTLVQRARSLFGNQRAELLEAQDPLPARVPDRCILLSGQPRSGTSLLTSILRTSPDLFQAYELHIRKPSFVVGNNGRYTRRIFEQLGLPPAEFDAIVASCDTGKMNLGSWTGPKEAVSAEALTGRETDNFQSELVARGRLTTLLLRKVAELQGRTRWGFKILGDVIHADAYAQAWPNATVILLVRDPRDHALSVMKLNEQRAERGQPSFYADYAAVADGWRETIEGGRRALEASGLAHVVLRYEDLVRQPEIELRRLSDALDVDLSGGMDFHKADFIESHTQRFKHHDNLKNPINTGSLEKWRKSMSEKDLAVFADVAGETMRAYGYDLA